MAGLATCGGAKIEVSAPFGYTGLIFPLVLKHLAIGHVCSDWGVSSIYTLTHSLKKPTYTHQQ